MTNLADSENGVEREALAAHHADRAGLHAPQSVHLTIYLAFDEPLSTRGNRPWYAVVVDSDSGRKIGAAGPDWSSHDVLQGIALIADKATVTP